MILSHYRYLFNRISAHSMLGAATLTLANAAIAQGLSKATGVLQTLQNELTSIIPICATILLLFIGLAYAGRFLEKEAAIRWAIGIIIAGSAVQITAMLFT
ncbi:TrwL protein [Mycoavidus cysteinexigens]|uniref:TrwL protein n=1 Tax=Mycoavidus cysteinexigens TaxID=1553431 RepID=A0A2Z6EXW6_9BURK|nr:TrbC/VirB2 family protein [Mycoavidus cysteinexigens]BBE10242.1 TrwL protein [Mycoavidus cysteinexigens]GAM53392.1 major pilus subunit of type IV secretion complex, VirB2 [bacterium endosymbiont of Mortierella elongata FMR23-6]GLR00659.1 hypothetical protein GCM10007934_04700 [Mycoavidus cysteinexigens]